MHPIKGAEMFAVEPGLAEVAELYAIIMNGSTGRGYPDGLAGEAIPLFSRIILVADAYEAMTHDRAYRRAVSPSEALDRLREGAGTQFDPTIVESFVTAMEQNKGK